MCFAKVLVGVNLMLGLVMEVVLLDLNDYKEHPCLRECKVGSKMVCEYNFTLENYYTMTRACHDCPFNATDCTRPHCVTTDGSPRGVLTVNRMLPGPAIHVCANDTIVVNVINEMSGGEGATIHWHGVHVPPIMDGVGLVTQCPIPTHSSFEYRFPATPRGTHYWHAHHGLQNGDGLFGPLIIREPLEIDVHSDEYDVDSPEHTVVMNDWTVNMYRDKFVRAYHYDYIAEIQSKSMLINGKGDFQKFSRENATFHIPYETFRVKSGTRYRFRLISNALNTCPMAFQIDNHTMTIIATDGSPVESHTIKSLTIYSGERIDVIVKADQSIGSYWIRASGLTTVCAYRKAFQLAIVRYEGAGNEEPEGIKRWIPDLPLPHYDPLNTKLSEGYSDISILNSTEPDDMALKSTPDRKLFIVPNLIDIENLKYYHQEYYSLVKDDQTLFTPQINHISSRLPPTPPQTQYGDIPQEMFCNEDTISSECNITYCSCIHTIKINLGEVIEFIIIDKGNTFASSHPFHMHGDYFRVIGLERVGPEAGYKEVKELDRKGLLKRRLNNAPLKDSVMVPDGGYTILRFHAKHPGFWFFHCHSAMHTELGMSVTLQVGSLDQQPAVPKNFPKCGPWKLNGYDEKPAKMKPASCSSNEPNGVRKLTNISNVQLFLLLCVVFGCFL